MADETNTTSRRPRRWLRWIGYVLGGLLVLLLAAYFVGTSEWALKSIILPKVSKAMNAQVTVESASISPFSSVNLRGLTVETARSEAEKRGSARSEPLLTAREVRARYSLMDIIKGNINVSEVALESPVVNLVTFPDGTSNLDPITKQPKEEKARKEPKEKKSEKPPHLNLHKLALHNATVRKIDERKDGTRQLLELTGVNITADDIGNHKTGQFGLTANVRMDQGLNTSGNGVFAATVGGKFNLVMDPALKPQVVKGQTKVDVTEAKGSFQQAAGLGITLNADLTPAQLNDVSVRFAQNGKNLGAIAASGPFNAETMEGKLAVAISQIDKQVLNLAGAALGIDFNQTMINSTNTIELTQRGRVVAVNGELVIGSFSTTTKGQTTPTLDVRSGYAVTYDQTNKTALVQTFTLNGTQNNAEFLRGTLARPMLLELGKGSSAVDESAFDLVVTNFNLPDWRAFVPTNMSLAGGRIGANVKLISRQGGKDLSAIGSVVVNDLTATIQSNSFDRFGTTVDLDVAMRGSALEIRKLIGMLQQSGRPGGSFEVAGNYHLTNKVGQITAKLTDLNQNTLKSFLAAALGDKQLESVTINATTTAKLDGPADRAVKAELHVANLVVNDPSGQVPKTPLAIDLVTDVSEVKGVLDLRTVQIALAKTERAPNSLNVAGRIDMSKSNAWTGNLKITSDGLDITPYYDLFAKDNAANTNALPGKTASVPPKESKPETEPAPVKLPFTQFVQEVNIAKFFLREIAISNLVTKATIDNGRVNVNPFSLTLNGAPVGLTALLNLAVAGYEYDVNAKLDGIPIEPLANTFAPEQRGLYKGSLLGNAALKGAGVTGRSLQQHLAGQVSFTLTNAEVRYTDVRFENRYVQWLVKWIGPVSRTLRIGELAESPISWVDSQMEIGNGSVNIRRTMLESSAFQAMVSGTIGLQPVLTNSTLNKLPLQLSIRRTLAEKARLAPPSTDRTGYVGLPNFVTIGGTVGKPDYDINSITVGRILAGAAGNIVGGDAGRILRGLGNLGQGGATNQTDTATNAPATNSAQNLIRGLGGVLQKPAKTNTAATNAPAQKKNEKFKLNDLLK